MTGGKRLNIGIEVPEDGDLRVVIDVENAFKTIKVRITEQEWDEMCRAQDYIIQEMDDEFFPGCSPPPIICGALTITLET
ncbi:hypothetical protein SGI37_20325, partial [Providencia rettgeri]